MTGWRIGFAVGNRNVIAGLGKIKTNLDSGVFQEIQEASITALQTDETTISKLRDVYQERRDVLYNGLTKLGFHAIKPRATFYLWTKVPPRFDSSRFVTFLLEKTG